MNLIGSFKPNMREADDACLRHATLVVDTLAALHDSGDLAGPLANGVIDASQVVLLNDLACGNRLTKPAAKTVFKSVGVAHADLTAAQHVYRAALAAVKSTRR